MRVRPLLVLLLLLLGATAATGETTPDQPTTITLWLMPVEPAADDRDLQNQDKEQSRESLPCYFELGPAQTPAETQQQIAAFNLKFGSQSPVTVLNTTDARWSYLLLNWNEEWGTTNWAMVRGQRRTLTSLCRFAERNRVHIRLLFANWTNAFSELQDRNHPFAPDVALIGSTWTAWFAKQKLLLPYSRVSGEQCHDVPGMLCAAIRYWTDVRLLFFWKRLPNASSTNESLQLNDTSKWEPILDAFEHQVREGGFPPFAFSVGHTPNLFYDYGQLIRSGRNDFLRSDTFGGPTVEFSSGAALEAPLLLNHRAAPPNQPRLIVFPEATHQEVLNQFTHGRYSAVIEQPAFLKRWKESFNRTSAPRAGADNFFDYAGFAVLPGFAFIGGSELAVWQRTKHPEMAFNLARFLAHDEENTKLLSSLGQLPAQRIDFGLDLLQASLTEKSSLPSSDTTRVGSAQFVRVVKQALAQGREFPDITEFSTAIESRDALDSIQRLWRRIGEGDQDGAGAARVTAAAKETEGIINYHTNTITRLLVDLQRRLWLVILVLGTIAVGASVLAWLLKQKGSMIEEVRQVRGFAASALLVVDSKHTILNSNPFLTPYTLPREAEKSLFISAGLRGWRRGQEGNSWLPLGLEDVVWHAVLSALFCVYKPELYSSWETEWSERRYQPREFLFQENILRKSPELEKDCAPFYFDVSGLHNLSIDMPFMLEQALACLIQNAIKATWDDTQRRATGIFISYNPETDLLSVANEGNPINRELRELLNQDRPIAEFEKKVNELLLGEHRPGVGLVEAYCIAKQCYGGLLIAEDRATVSIRLHSRHKRRVLRRLSISLLAIGTKLNHLRSYRSRPAIDAKSDI